MHLKFTNSEFQQYFSARDIELKRIWYVNLHTLAVTRLPLSFLSGIREEDFFWILLSALLPKEIGIFLYLIA